MINLDVAEFHIGVIEAAGYKSVPVDCAMMRELITRLRQAEQDAARYRWLRESTHFDSMQHKLYCLHYGERLDIAIDEAMQCNK